MKQGKGQSGLGLHIATKVSWNGTRNCLKFILDNISDFSFKYNSHYVYKVHFYVKRNVNLWE